jgi:hypothetical protein
MAPTTRATANWAISRVVALPEFWALAATNWATIDRVVSLPEFWALVAEHSGFVGAWGLTGVCKASREGVKG